MNVPRLTIIMPTLQAERTLRESLDSVVRQQFGDFEVLIMDSVSRDDTLSIARRYAAGDHRIRVYSSPDTGIYDAMNRGIHLARGEWVYFLGSDDWLHDGKVLQDVFSFPDIVQHDLLYGDVVSPSYSGAYDGVFTYEKLLKRNVSHQACFYRRNLFSRLGEYSLRYRAYADWEFNIRCWADAGVRTRYIDRVIADFGADGLSSRHDVPFLREALFPAKLRLLSATGPRVLRRPVLYDEWWRLLRNAEMRGRASLEQAAGEIPVATVIKGMASWQKVVPMKMLRIGVCSKLLMFASYLRHLLTGAI